jgi:hypothetical protein
MITLRYENVSHLYFSCGRIGHVAVNCDDTVEVQEVAYGEELRASPPRRTKEIMVKPSATRVARLLFQVVDMHKRSQPAADRSTGGGTTSETRFQSQVVGKDGQANKQDGTTSTLSTC